MEDASWQKNWLIPMATLATMAVATFALLYAVDHYLTGGPASDADPTSLFRYLFFDENHIPDAVSSLGAMVAGVLGIVVSVVSIVVQLSAGRYTGVAVMFFRDRTNIAVMGYYVVACVVGVLVSLSVRSDFVPRLTLLAMMGAVAVGLVMMAPYFAYVFRFLEPTNIIARIQRLAMDQVRRGTSTDDPRERAAAQHRTLVAIEELLDITSNSISGKDKIIASRAVDALKDLAVEHLAFKANASTEWFTIGEAIRKNPDFVALDPESRDDLVERRTWVEWMVLRKLFAIFNEALTTMRDITYLVAIDTRYVGEAAQARGDRPLVELVLRYMNSYLRAALNARDVRTAYNVLNQYRLLVEALLRGGEERLSLEAVAHLRYYAHLSNDMKLGFITETIAYDVGAICQLSHELRCRIEGELLRIFLDIDRPSKSRAEDSTLRGVRKAQVKLAAFYVLAGADAEARQIRDDMLREPAERLRAIRDELARVESKDFWEIIDRGRNFEYLPPEQKDAMHRFFETLGIERESLAAAS